METEAFDARRLRYDIKQLTIHFEQCKGNYAITNAKNITYKSLLEQAAEEIENCYGRDTELTEKIRKML